MPSETRVVHVHDNVPGAVYIGCAMPRQGLRGSKWGNPHRVDVHGRVRAIMFYRDDILESPDLLSDLPELRGKALACWCRHEGEAETPDNRCHGDVLMALLDVCTDDELLALAEEATNAR